MPSVTENLNLAAMQAYDFFVQDRSEVLMNSASSVALFGVFFISLRIYAENLKRRGIEAEKGAILGGLGAAISGSCLLWRYTTGTYLTDALPVEIPKPAIFAAGCVTGAILAI